MKILIYYLPLLLFLGIVQSYFHWSWIMAFLGVLLLLTSYFWSEKKTHHVPCHQVIPFNSLCITNIWKENSLEEVQKYAAITSKGSVRKLLNIAFGISWEKTLRLCFLIRKVLGGRQRGNPKFLACCLRITVYSYSMSSGLTGWGRGIIDFFSISLERAFLISVAREKNVVVTRVVAQSHTKRIPYYSKITFNQAHFGSKVNDSNR